MGTIHYEYHDAADVPKYGDNPAMASNGRGLRDVIKFDPNVPVALSLKYRKAKIIKTQRGPRAMFTLTLPSAVMFLDRDVALKIEALEVVPGEVFWVCRRNSGERGALDMWDVYLDPATERARTRPEPPAATPVVKPTTQTDSGPMAEMPRDERSLQNQHNTQIHLGWAQFLIATTNGLVAAYSACLTNARQQFGEAVKPTTSARCSSLPTFSKPETEGHMSRKKRFDTCLVCGQTARILKQITVPLPPVLQGLGIEPKVLRVLRRHKCQHGNWCDECREAHA